MTGSGFLDALAADGPAADRAGTMDLYGWLIGGWGIDVTRFLKIRFAGAARPRGTRTAWQGRTGVSVSSSSPSAPGKPTPTAPAGYL
jgi:hypothetical protein